MCRFVFPSFPRSLIRCFLCCFQNVQLIFQSFIQTFGRAPALNPSRVRIHFVLILSIIRAYSSHLGLVFSPPPAPPVSTGQGARCHGDASPFAHRSPYLNAQACAGSRRCGEISQNRHPEIVGSGRCCRQFGKHAAACGCAALTWAEASGKAGLRSCDVYNAANKAARGAEAEAEAVGSANSKCIDYFSTLTSDRA